MTPPTLLITDRLPFLWHWLGINYGQMRAILVVKLQLDNRRPVSFNQWKKAKESTNAYWKSILFYAFFGLAGAVFLGFTPAVGIVKPAMLFFSFVLSVCTLSLISDFSSVILDSSDNQIMLFRPVDSRTLLTARVVHIISYLFTIALAVGAAGTLVISYRFGGLAGLLTLLLCLLTAILAVFLTNIIYLLLIQFMSGERLREVINYVQIGMGVFFYGASQLFPRLIGSDTLTGDVPFVWKPWHYAIPPFWSAGSLDMMINRHIDWQHLLLLGLALMVPFAGIYVMATFLSSSFNGKLATLDHEEKAKIVHQNTGTLPARSLALPLADRMANWFTNNPLERAGFTFVWYMTGRDRKFKLRTYPSLGFGLVYTVIMSLNYQLRLSETGNNVYLFMLYFGGIYSLTALGQITISDNYKAAWVYESSPMSQPGLLLAGGLKAVVVKLMLPFYCLLSGYVLYLKGASILPNVFLVFVNSLVMILTSSVLNKRHLHLPFSMAPNIVHNGNTTARSFAGLFVLVLIGTAHWGLTYVPYSQWVALPVMIGVCVLLFRSYQKTTWGEVEN